MYKPGPEVLLQPANAPCPGLGQGSSIGTSFQCCPALIRTAEAEYQTGGRK